MNIVHICKSRKRTSWSKGRGHPPFSSPPSSPEERIEKKTGPPSEGEEQTQIPIFRLPRKRFFPQYFVVGQPKKHFSELQFEQFPTPATFRVGRRVSTQKCVSGSNYPSESMRWITEVEMATSVDDLKRSILEICSLTSRRLMRRSLPPWRRSSQIRTSRKRSIWHSRRLKKMTDSFTDSFHDLWTFPGNRRSCGCSRLLWSLQYIFTWRTTFKDFDTRWTIVWKACIRCAYVGLSTQNCFGIRRTRNWTSSLTPELPDEEMIG